MEELTNIQDNNNNNNNNDEAETWSRSDRRKYKIKHFLKTHSDLELISVDQSDHQDDEEISPFVKQTVSQKKVILDSKIMTTEKIEQLHGKLKERKSSTRGRGRRGRGRGVPLSNIQLEERNAIRTKKSLKLIDSAICYLLKHSSFVHKYIRKPKEYMRVMRDVSQTNKHLKNDNQADNNNMNNQTRYEQIFCMTEDYLLSFEIVVSILQHSHMFHELNLFFWSSYITEFIQMLNPVIQLQFSDQIMKMDQ